MKRLILTTCLCFASLSLAFAQNLFQQRIYENVFRLTKVLTLDDGYLILGHREREENINNNIERHYEPFLTKLDRGLQTVWETRFPESELRTFNHLVAANGGYYLNGNHHPMGSQKCQAKLVKVSSSGDIEFEKHFSYPGYHSVEGFQMLPLPGGDLIVCNRKYRNYGSLGLTWILRVTPEGEQVWEKNFGTNYNFAGPNQFKLSSQGKVHFFGFCYLTKGDFDRSNASGWICAFNPDNPNEIYTDKGLSNRTNYILKGGIELADGGWWLLGNATDMEKKAKIGVLEAFNFNWQVTRSQEFSQPNGLRFEAFCWDGQSSQLKLAGYTGNHPSWKGILLNVNLDWVTVGTREGDQGIHLQVESPGNGELVLVHDNQINLLN